MAFYGLPRRLKHNLKHNSIHIKSHYNVLVSISSITIYQYKVDVKSKVFDKDIVFHQLYSPKGAPKRSKTKFKNALKSLKNRPGSILKSFQDIINRQK